MTSVANTYPENDADPDPKNALNVIISKKFRLTLSHCLQILLDLVCEQMAKKLKQNIFYKQFFSKKCIVAIRWRMLTYFFWFLRIISIPAYPPPPATNQHLQK